MFRQDLLLTWPSGIGIRKVKITNNNNNYISVSDSSSRTVKLRLSGTDAIDILYNVHDSKLLQFWRLAREHLLVLPEPVYPFAGVTYKRWAHLLIPKSLSVRGWIRSSKSVHDPVVYYFSLFCCNICHRNYLIRRCTAAAVLNRVAPLLSLGLR